MERIALGIGLGADKAGGEQASCGTDEGEPHVELDWLSPDKRETMQREDTP